MIKLGLLWYDVYNLSVSMLHTEMMGMCLHGDEANVSVSSRKHYHITYPSQLASCLSVEIGKLVLPLGKDSPGVENSHKMSAAKAKLF